MEAQASNVFAVGERVYLGNVRGVNIYGTIGHVYRSPQDGQLVYLVAHTVGSFSGRECGYYGHELRKAAQYFCYRATAEAIRNTFPSIERTDDGDTDHN